MIFAASVASAQSREPELADALFRAARELSKEGKLSEACPKFAESYALDPAVGTLLNLGDCEEKLGHPARALWAFLQAKDQMSRADDRQAFVDARLLELGKRVPRILIRLPLGAPEGSNVEQDGKPVPAAALGVSVPVEPGPHRFVLRAPGYEAQTTEWTARLGGAEELQLKLGARVVRTSSLTPKPAPRTWGYISLGAGAVLLGTGVVSGISFLNSVSDFKEHCDPDTRICRDQIGEDARSRGKLTQWLAPTTLGIGAAATGLGLYLLLRPQSPVQVSVDPAAGQLYVQGKF